MSDCVRYGVTVVDGEEHGGGYCTISVEANYPNRRAQTPFVVSLVTRMMNLDPSVLVMARYRIGLNFDIDKAS